MYCPNCIKSNAADAPTCVHCGQETGYFRERLFVGQQFVFVQADEAHPLALVVDDGVQVYRAATILSRHHHSFNFGDEVAANPAPTNPLQRIAQQVTGRRELPIYPLSALSRQPTPTLDLFTVVTDRKIYRPEDETFIFAVAPDWRGEEVDLEIRFQGQKVYEARVGLNEDGLALYRYDDLREGEYTILLSHSKRAEARAEATFTVAEYSLSPLIATLVEHRFSDRMLSFTFDLRLLSAPYSGSVELGLQCQVCGDRIVATQQAKAKAGKLQGKFDISSHGGPFHVQVTTPDGNTAMVNFPGTGMMERNRVLLNPLGQTVEVGLLPDEATLPVRGFYLSEGKVNMTPLMLENAHATTGRFQTAADLDRLQLIFFDPRSRTNRIVEHEGLKRGQVIEFEVAAPYTMFTLGAFLSGQPQPFEGWGVVVRPVDFEATLTAPATARPGETIEVELEAIMTDGNPASAFCWLLVYDARLEHESPIPKLAKQIYETIRAAGSGLEAQSIAPASEAPPSYPPTVFRAVRAGAMPPMAIPAAAPMAFAAGTADALLAEPQAVRPRVAMAMEETATLVETPARMAFPELAYQEFFFVGGKAARTINLGDQIGTWRVRAYLFRGADYRELTTDVQADKPLYAELDLPAIASDGDQITAAVNYQTPAKAQLVITTRFGETRRDVNGNGVVQFPIQGPTQVDVRLENGDGADWSVRDVAPPGRQEVTASRLVILKAGEMVKGERVVVYRTMGEVLKETIDALVNYPFG